MELAKPKEWDVWVVPSSPAAATPPQPAPASRPPIDPPPPPPLDPPPPAARPIRRRQRTRPQAPRTTAAQLLAFCCLCAQVRSPLHFPFFLWFGRCRLSRSTSTPPDDSGLREGVQALPPSLARLRLQPGMEATREAGEDGGGGPAAWQLSRNGAAQIRTSTQASRAKASSGKLATPSGCAPRSTSRACRAAWWGTCSWWGYSTTMYYYYYNIYY
jgi:hypothetical protein